MMTEWFLESPSECAAPHRPTNRPSADMTDHPLCSTRIQMIIYLLGDQHPLAAVNVTAFEFQLDTSPHANGVRITLLYCCNMVNETRCKSWSIKLINAHHTDISNVSNAFIWTICKDMKMRSRVAVCFQSVIIYQVDFSLF